jgi:hypothetical protein
MRIHKRSEHPRMVEAEQFSVDVITCDENGLINLGFYNFDSDTWSFHTDTLYDYTNIEFVWMYVPVNRMVNALENKEHERR